MHEGHRRRMYGKLANDSALLDHELLEILLFNGCPRVNTNPIAHALINEFGSLAGVLDADLKSLKTVKGVGESVALYIKLIGDIYRRVSPFNAGVAVLKNVEDFKKFASVRMRGRIDEALEIYCLEKNGKVTRIISFTDYERNKVEVEVDKLSHALAAECPYGIVVAHNHLSGNSSPSVNDDRFTAELQLMCSLNKVVLYDHCIYASDANMYSYFASGKIDDIRRNFSLDKVIDERFKLSAEENKK